MSNSTKVSPSAMRAAQELTTMVSRLRRRLKDVATVDDLTPTQTSVLSRLAKDGPASTSDLAAAERVRPQSMATTLAALDERGMLRRDADPHDGRRQLISISPQALQLVEGKRRERNNWLADALQERFSETERVKIIDVLALLERVTDS